MSPLQAGAHFREAIRLRPRWFEPRRDLGRLLLRRGELEQAERELEEAVGLAPAEVELRLLYAETLLRRGDLPAAPRTLDEGLATVAPALPIPSVPTGTPGGISSRW